MADIAGTHGNQHILHSERTPFLELVIFREGDAWWTGRESPPARQPISGASYTFFAVTSPVFARSQRAHRSAPGALTVCRGTGRFCRWISLLARSNAARSCPVRHARARSR